MYLSLFLIYFSLRARVTPNMITVTYIFCGILTAILLAIPNPYCNVAALFLAFNKGVLDWSDGHLARLKYKATLTGHVLDEYGAVINSIGFYMGIGFFYFNQTDMLLLIYAMPFLTFFYSCHYKNSGSAILIRILPKIIKSKNSTKRKKIRKNKNVIKNKILNFFFSVASNILDSRARVTDSIILLICYDIFNKTSHGLIFYFLIFFTLLVKFLISLISGIFNNWAEFEKTNMQN